MRTDGLQRMLDFLNLLQEKNIHYFISHYSSEGLTATLTLVTVRIEVEFTPDEMRYSVFKGTEDVLTDEAALHGLLKEFGE
jgi:hypothetical protein